VGAVSQRLSGETVCGEAWKCWQSAQVFKLIVADGLGHGPLAEEAASAAVQVFDLHPDAEPASLLELANRALSGTRGAAIAVALIDLQAGRMKYSGIGNIAGQLLTHDGHQGLVSNNGIVGVNQRKKQQFDYTCPESGLLIMHSDGIRSRWTLNDYPGLSMRHPAVISGVLSRECRRGRDDVTVVVVRFGSARI
jgi:hypothetical protein